MPSRSKSLTTCVAAACAFTAWSPVHAQSRGDSAGVARGVFDYIASQYTVGVLKAPEQFVFPKVYRGTLAPSAAYADGWSELRVHVPQERVRAGESTPPCSGPDGSVAISAKAPTWAADGSVAIDVVTGCLGPLNQSATGLFYVWWGSEQRYTLIKGNGNIWKVVRTDLIARS
jgi:hypothetical protein